MPGNRVGRIRNRSAKPKQSVMGRKVPTPKHQQNQRRRTESRSPQLGEKQSRIKRSIYQRLRRRSPRRLHPMKRESHVPSRRSAGLKLSGTIRGKPPKKSQLLGNRPVPKRQVRPGNASPQQVSRARPSANRLDRLGSLSRTVTTRLLSSLARTGHSKPRLFHRTINLPIELVCDLLLASATLEFAQTVRDTLNKRHF